MNLPRLTGNFVSRWLVVTLALSIATAIEGGHLAHWLSLSPHDIFRGQVWRLATWPLVETGPLELIFTCAAIYKFGGDLAAQWGDRRLRRFAIDVTLFAAVATCIVSLLSPIPVFRLGGWAITDALVIAWARQFPARPLRIYELFHLHGRDLALFTLGVAALFAVFYGPIAVAPELAACAIAFFYPKRRLRT
ncbi:MAG TPA: rhomboid family intramembrane serine protease [Kofleriaceae bacterium]